MLQDYFCSVFSLRLLCILCVCVCGSVCVCANEKLPTRSAITWRRDEQGRRGGGGGDPVDFVPLLQPASSMLLHSTSLRICGANEAAAARVANVPPPTPLCSSHHCTDNDNDNDEADLAAPHRVQKAAKHTRSSLARAGCEFSFQLCKYDK